MYCMLKALPTENPKQFQMKVFVIWFVLQHKIIQRKSSNAVVRDMINELVWLQIEKNKKTGVVGVVLQCPSIQQDYCEGYLLYKKPFRTE